MYQHDYCAKVMMIKTCKQTHLILEVKVKVMFKIDLHLTSETP